MLDTLTTLFCPKSRPGPDRSKVEQFFPPDNSLSRRYVFGETIALSPR